MKATALICFSIFLTCTSFLSVKTEIGAWYFFSSVPVTEVRYNHVEKFNAGLGTGKFENYKKPNPRSVIHGKQEVFISDRIAFYDPGIDETQKMYKQWKKFVDPKCRSEFGCSYDLNFYKTKEDAEKALTDLQLQLADTSKYIVHIVSFKVR